jgi:two-component system, LytTR family, sensor kinase
MSAPGELVSMPGTARMHTHVISVMRVVIPGLLLLLWTLVSLTEKVVLVHSPGVPLWKPLALALASTAAVGGWLLWALRSGYFERVSVVPPRYWFGRYLRALPLMIVGDVLLVLTLREGAFRFLDVSYGYIPFHLLLVYESIKTTLFYIIWLALLFGILALQRWREDSERMMGVQKALAEAQLSQLQAQLRPHFLFNALNTVSSLMMTDTVRADRMLAQLGDLLRASLSAGRHAPVPLRDELKVLGKYADIMQERFEGRAVLQWDVADDVLDVPVPPMLLQPLLENAFKHGVERNTEPVRIVVRAARIGDSLRVAVHNTGSSLKTNGAAFPDSATVSDERPSGFDDYRVGLRNCRERLRLLYGSAAALNVSDEPTGGGVCASVKLPCPSQTVH